VLGLESEQRLLAQFTSNAGRALEISQATFSGLQQFKSVSDRATEIGTLGTGMISSEASLAYASEVDQLIEHTLQLGNTRFRNDYLFAGTAASLHAAAVHPTLVRSLEYSFQRQPTPLGSPRRGTRRSTGEIVENGVLLLGDAPGWGVAPPQ
jgi:flagellin-like hook-associated protein FlgL